MGWKSTQDLPDRDTVLRMIYDVLEDATDEELCDALEALTPNSGANYRIVSGKEE